MLFAVKLDQGDSLDQLPGNGLGQHRSRLRLLFSHNEVHLRRQVAPACAPHPLQEARHGEWRVDLEGPLEPTDIDAEFQGRGGDGCLALLVIAHELFGALPI